MQVDLEGHTIHISISNKSIIGVGRNIGTKEVSLRDTLRMSAGTANQEIGRAARERTVD